MNTACFTNEKFLFIQHIGLTFDIETLYNILQLL